MRVEQRSTYDNDGAYVRILEYTTEDDDDTDVGYDRVVVRVPPDIEMMVVKAFDGDDTVYHERFEMRELSFDPISIIGRGETTRMTGTTPASGDTTDSVPSGVQTALNSLGMAVVPQGEWWL